MFQVLGWHVRKTCMGHHEIYNPVEEADNEQISYFKKKISNNKIINLNKVTY